MGLSVTDLRLLAAIQDGLPLDPRPYARVAEAAGLSEQEVIARLDRLACEGVIRRFGVVVRHHELGYRANAMVVWDVPEVRAREAGRKLARLPFVTLCYRRPRRPPDWPYNLFCMIHGRDRAKVEALVEEASAAAGLEGLPREILFSRKRFKQRGARYAPCAPNLRKAG
jgi:DNA-binding Lrp family transcriptional regulator